MKKTLIFSGCLLLIITCTKGNLIAQNFIEEDRFNISGFAEFVYVKMDIDELDKDNPFNLIPMMNDNGCFSQARLNFYFSFQVTSGWLMFSEIQFFYVPNGQYTQGTGDYDGVIGTDTTTINTVNGEQTAPYLYAAPNNTTFTDNTGVWTEYGSIHIERAYIEWNTLPYATFRVGRYLTPFGLWSQDHGSPVLISTRVPILTSGVGDMGMPPAQTGVELVGKLNIPLDILMEYAAYVGNGINKGEAASDSHDSNKAFGGYLNFKLPSIGDIMDIELGGSGYNGQRTNIFYLKYTPYAGFSFDYGPYVLMNQNTADNRYTSKQKETSALAHLKISLHSLPFEGSLVLQGEGLYQWIDPMYDGRVVDITGLPLTPVAFEDFHYETYYGQIEYRFFGKYTPFFRYEYVYTSSKKASTLSVFQKGRAYDIGLNLKPFPRITIKLENYIIYISSPIHEISQSKFAIYGATVTAAF